jgi:transposase
MENGFKPHITNQSWMEVINPSEIINKDPLLKAINWFFENHCDISIFKTENLSHGRKALHPKMLLKVLAYSYSQKIYSSREIENKLRTDIKFKAISGNCNCDHSSICNFIVHNEEEISSIFAKLVYILMEMGYVDLDFIAVDGTKIRAYVGAKFTGKKEDFEKRKKTLTKKIKKLIKEKTSAPEEKERNEKKLNQFQKDKEKIDNFLQEISDKKKSRRRKD